MNYIYIEPGPSNPEGTDGGRWKIMIMDNDKPRHLNDADDHLDATIKADRTANKRGITFVGHDTKTPAAVATPVVATPVVDDWNGEKWLRPCRRPRGAPEIGARIRHTISEDEYRDVEVISYLDEQFVTKLDDGTTRVVHLQDNWELIS